MRENAYMFMRQYNLIGMCLFQKTALVALKMKVTRKECQDETEKAYSSLNCVYECGAQSGLLLTG